jgi:hypothetical protein
MRIGDYYAVGKSAQLAALDKKFDDGSISAAEKKLRDQLRKDKNHYITETFDSRSAAKRAAQKYQKLGMTSYFNESKEQLTAAAVKVPGFAMIESYIAAEIPDADVRKEVTSMFTKMALEMAPEGSALKQMMKREGVAGAHSDMRQVFAKSSLTQAHYISRLEFSNELMQKLQGVIKEGAGGNINMQQVGNELTLRTKASLELDDHPVLDKIVNASYFAHLGVSPAFLLVNMTQVPIITFPWLGARFGFRSANTALATAARDAFNIVKTTVSKDGWRSDIDWKNQFPEGSNEDLMLTELLKRNLLDITMEHDLGATARMGGGKFAMGNIAKMVNTPVGVSWPFLPVLTVLTATRTPLRYR